jgi:hypothetical protein
MIDRGILAMMNRSAASKGILELSTQPVFSGGNRLIVLLVFALLLLLSSCGGGSGGGGGSNRELQLYQDAMTAYQTGNFSSAASLFSQELTEFPTGTYSDESQYRLGRSQQALNNFTEARAAYSLVSNTGSWVVDAAFYAARTYYDEAGITTVPAAAFALYDTAITRLVAVNATYSTSNLVDQTRYYIGRTYQDQATLLKRDSTLSIQTALQLFINARTRYDTVQTTSVFYDNAVYFKGRSYHEQVVPDYANARLTYQILIAANISSWADDAQYQYAKTFYDEAGDELVAATAMAGFNTAIAELDTLITSTNPLYQASNRADSARYYKGRSLHKQAMLVEADPTLDAVNNFAQYFLNARVAYQSVIDLAATSLYDDNAQYRIGRTYYDEAVIALATPDYAAMQQNLSDAIAALTVVTTDSIYQTSNSADNAYYYLGRSYQRGAEIPAVNRASVTGGIDFTGVSFAEARGWFEVLTGTSTTASTFPASAWIDNAYYETGNTWRGQVLNATSTDSLTDYTAALSNYNKVLVDYKGVSTREDNAARKVATVYHETGDCPNELAAYTYVKTIATATVFSIAEADTHLADLQLATPVTHSCVVTLPGLPGFTTP